MNLSRLKFIHMPAYARFLLDHKLDAYVRTQIQFSRDENIPILKYFDWMSETELIEFGTGTAREWLESFVNNTVPDFMERAISNWNNNQLPGLQHDQIVAEDITSVSLIRKRTLSAFLPSYTTDISTCLAILGEIDRYLAEFESGSFKTFHALQHQEIHKINEALQARHAELTEAQEIARMGSFEWNIQTADNILSPSLVHIFELEGKSNLHLFLEKVHPDDRGKVTSAIEASFNTESGVYDCEYRYIGKSGIEKVLWSRGIVSFADGKPLIMKGTVMDVTDRHALIIRMQESESLYKQAQALTHIGNWAWNIKENTVSWSDEMYRIYGMEPQSMEITLEKFSSFVHPEDRARRLGEIQEALRTLRSPEYVMRIVTPAGKVKTLRGHGGILVDSDKKPYRMVGTCQDITTEFRLHQELRQREEKLGELNTFLEQKNAELEKQNKALESFNHAISHDLQEPLRKIQVFSSMLQYNGKKMTENTKEEVINKINLSATRLRKLIRDLFSYSFLIEDENSSAETSDLNLILQDVINDYQLVIEERDVKIIAGPLPLIYARTTLMYQLFQNLLGNAVKYAKEGVRPEVKISSMKIKGSEIKEVAGLRNDTFYHRISVQDNGIGLEEQYADKIFSLFQRLHNKNEYTGTGLGLAMCKKIMDFYDGQISVKSEPGMGALFNIYFPINKEPETS